MFPLLLQTIINQMRPRRLGVERVLGDGLFWCSLAESSMPTDQPRRGQMNWMVESSAGREKLLPRWNMSVCQSAVWLGQSELQGCRIGLAVLPGQMPWNLCICPGPVACISVEYFEFFLYLLLAEVLRKVWLVCWSVASVCLSVSLSVPTLPLAVQQWLSPDFTSR